jgi:hypothetical protein
MVVLTEEQFTAVVTEAVNQAVDKAVQAAVADERSKRVRAEAVAQDLVADVDGLKQRNKQLEFDRWMWGGAAAVVSLSLGFLLGHL